MRKSSIFLLICLCVTMLFHVHALYQKYSFSKLKTETVQGVVINIKYQSSNKPCYLPVYNYTLKDGSNYTYQSAYAYTKDRFQVGESVTLYYNPQKPDEVKPNWYFGDWMYNIFASIFLLLVIICFILINLMKRY
jgi:hypothetical protein